MTFIYFFQFFPTIDIASFLNRDVYLFKTVQQYSFAERQHSAEVGLDERHLTRRHNKPINTRTDRQALIGESAINGSRWRGIVWKGRRDYVRNHCINITSTVMTYLLYQERTISKCDNILFNYYKKYGK